MRILLITGAGLALLLAACQPGASPSSSVAPAVSVAPSSEPSMMAETSPAAMSCTDAFSSVASTISGIASLNDAQDRLDATIQSCPNLDDWTTAAKTVMPNVDLSQAQAFVAARCQASSALASTPLCSAVSP